MEDKPVQRVRKLVIVINGRGGAGKDTLCDLASKHFKVRNVSSITPIKEIALQNGWNGEKDKRSRKFLSDLKRVFIEYNDLPNRYLLRQYEEFLQSDEEILFLHIREPEEIEKFRNEVKDCLTLLVRRERNSERPYGNRSDDEVEAFEYDHCFENNGTLKETEERFSDFLRNRFGEIK